MGQTTKTHVRWWLLRFGLEDFDLTRADEHAVKRFTREIRDALDGAIVLSLWLEEFNADPFAWREGRRTAETDDSLAGGDFYEGADGRVHARHGT